jgi:hypothetical protein
MANPSHMSLTIGQLTIAFDPANDSITILPARVLDRQMPKTEPATTEPAAPEARTVAVGVSGEAYIVGINGVPHELAYISDAEREVIDAIRDGLGRFQWNHVKNPPMTVSGTMVDMGGRTVPSDGWIKWDRRELANHGVMHDTIIDVLTGGGQVYSNQPRGNFGDGTDISSWRLAWRKPEAEPKPELPEWTSQVPAGCTIAGKPLTLARMVEILEASGAWVSFTVPSISVPARARKEGYDQGHSDGFRAGYEKARQIYQGKG